MTKNKNETKKKKNKNETKISIQYLNPIPNTEKKSINKFPFSLDENKAADVIRPKSNARRGREERRVIGCIIDKG